MPDENFIHALKKYLLNVCYVPGSLVHIETRTCRCRSLFSHGLDLEGEIQEARELLGVRESGEEVGKGEPVNSRMLQARKALQTKEERFGEGKGLTV